MTTYQMIEAIEEANRTWQPLSLPVRNGIAKRLDELERENASLKSHMTEAWKLVNAMAGQEYWQRAEDWLTANSWAKPSDMV
jgi:hypothetical protein